MGKVFREKKYTKGNKPTETGKWGYSILNSGKRYRKFGFSSKKAAQFALNTFELQMVRGEHSDMPNTPIIEVLKIPPLRTYLRIAQLP